MMLPWRPLLTAATVAAAAAIGSRLDCNPTVFFYDSVASRFKKQSYYADKRIWIIGASSGIGREMALQLADCTSSSSSSSPLPHSSTCITPPRVVILSGRNVEKLEKVAQQCREIQEQNLSTLTTRRRRTTFCVVPLDVTDHKSLKYVVRQKVPAMLQALTGNGQGVVDIHPPASASSTSLSSLLDIIVLNSGAGHLSPALQTSPKVIEQVIQTNAVWPMIFMPLLLNSAATPEVTTAKAAPATTTRRTTPHFIVMSSIAADLRAVPLSAAYAASKAALTTYFCSLAAERPDLAMDVCLPGPVDTDFHRHHIGTMGNAATTTTRRLDSDKKRNESSSSPLKMSVHRCAQLVLSAASMRQSNKRHSSYGYRHIWIAPQPVLTILYLHQWMPSLLLNKLFARMGPKRIAMWEAGLDLYDPQSWLQQQQKQQQENNNMKSQEDTR